MAMSRMQAETAGLEEISRRLCRLLDSIGYNMDMITFRRIAMQHMGIFTKHHIKEIPVGRRGEGISKVFESDQDVLIVLTPVVATTVSIPSPVHSDLETSLRIRKTHPGYCTLQLLKQGTFMFEEIFNSLIPYDGEWFLSGNLLNTELKDFLTPPDSTVCYSGPAKTLIDIDGNTYDNVISFNFDCYDILHEWSTRPRKYDWPSQHLLQKALGMKGNLVSKGMNESETKHLEWRFCFNEIELLLIESLNDTQIKLYKMLKMINTDILKPQDFSVTSYMLKNIVFWLAEVYPQAMFRPETLIYWIVKALQMLKRAVKLNNIPYFMIPGRNLLQEKISLEERKPLFDTLSVLIKMGSETILDCKKIKEARHMTPTELSLLLQNNNEFETAYYCLFNRVFVLSRQGVPEEEVSRDEILMRQKRKMMYLVKSFEWPPYIREKLNKCLTLVDSKRVLLC